MERKWGLLYLGHWPVGRARAGPRACIQTGYVQPGQECRVLLHMASSEDEPGHPRHTHPRLPVGSCEPKSCSCGRVACGSWQMQCRQKVFLAPLRGATSRLHAASKEAGDVREEEPRKWEPGQLAEQEAGGV